MVHIKIKDNESFDRAFKRFTKACEKAGLIASIKKYQFFEKPSQERKRRLNTAKRKMRKLANELMRMRTPRAKRHRRR